MSIALENQYSRFNWALGIESEGFSEGTYCVRAGRGSDIGRDAGDRAPARASISGVARRATLRASDSDREAVAERLRAAAAEGRIVAEELEERLATALRARTYGELDVLVADLPARSGRPPAAASTRASGHVDVADRVRCRRSRS